MRSLKVCLGTVLKRIRDFTCFSDVTKQIPLFIKLIINVHGERHVSGGTRALTSRIAGCSHFTCARIQSVSNSSQRTQHRQAYSGFVCAPAAG